MSKDKIEGFLVGVGAGILFTALLQARKEWRKRPEKAGNAQMLTAQFSPAIPPAEPLEVNARGVHA